MRQCCVFFFVPDCGPCGEKEQSSLQPSTSFLSVKQDKRCWCRWREVGTRLHYSDWQGWSFFSSANAFNEVVMEEAFSPADSRGIHGEKTRGCVSVGERRRLALWRNTSETKIFRMIWAMLYFRGNVAKRTELGVSSKNRVPYERWLHEELVGSSSLRWMSSCRYHQIPHE